MHEIIDQLILKKRRELYKVLNAGKKVKPMVYFIIELNGELSEIIVPGCEAFFKNDLTKDLLGEFIQMKWREYSRRPGIKLCAVVLVSDVWYSKLKWGEGETPDQAVDRFRKEHGRPRNDPNRMDVLTFFIWFEEDDKMLYFPYRRTGKNIEFYEEPEMKADQLSEGRFKNLFPKI